MSSAGGLRAGTVAQGGTALLAPGPPLPRAGSQPQPAPSQLPPGMETTCQPPQTGMLDAVRGAVVSPRGGRPPARGRPGPQTGLRPRGGGRTGRVQSRDLGSQGTCTSATTSGRPRGPCRCRCAWSLTRHPTGQARVPAHKRSGANARDRCPGRPAGRSHCCPAASCSPRLPSCCPWPAICPRSAAEHTPQGTHAERKPSADAALGGWAAGMCPPCSTAHPHSSEGPVQGGQH